MNRQTSTDVIINGKQYTLSGYESGEYMHRVASYLNEKYEELKNLPSYRQLDGDMRNVLLQLNIADDYFKLKDQMR
ncbi:MAG: cell division protein ZapA, partial [Lachnospiraceae bacterium]|nr:cell division protein ZapA [Lachnospiraceae bacterium]